MFIFKERYIIRITILTAGTLGDIIPYVFLAKELIKKNYSICMTIDYSLLDKMEDKNIIFFPIHDPYILKKDKKSINIIKSGGGKKFIKNMNAHKEHDIYSFLEDCKESTKNSSLILYSNLGYAGPHLSEYYNIPAIAIPLTPTYPSKFYTALNINTPPIFPKTFNRLTHTYSEFIFWQGIKKPINKWRKESLKLTTISLFGPFKKIRESKQPFIYLFSQALFNRPRDWPKHVKIIGFIGGKSELLFNNTIENFLQKGYPDLIFAFGPTWEENYETRLQICINTVTSLKMRAILIGPNKLKKAKQINENILHVPYGSYEKLFPLTKIVIHHAGSGVISMAIKSGIPFLSYPMFGDQFLWAKSIKNKDTVITTFSESKLRLQIQNILTNYEENIENINKLKKQMNYELAETHIVEIIENFLKDINENNF